MNLESGAALLENDLTEDEGQYLTFLLSGELFAIHILSIKEIIEYGNITEVPLMPDFVRGVMNLRGSVVPVIDLSARFGRASKAVGKRTCIVIIEVEYDHKVQDIGVVVDSVCEVKEMLGKDIEDAPSFGANLRPEFIRGMGKEGEQFVIILDIDKVLSLEDLNRMTHKLSHDCIKDN